MVPVNKIDKCRDCGETKIIHSKRRCFECAKSKKLAKEHRFQDFVEFLRNHKSDVFIETGTFGGGGVLAANACGFREIHSIEMAELLFNISRRAINREVGHKPYIHLYHGDSGELIGPIIKKIPKSKSITFWLDAHYGGKDTVKTRRKGEKAEISPLKRELESILSCDRLSNDIVLVDNVKHLSTFGYTFESLCEHLLRINKNFEISVVGKTVVAVPKKV